MKTQSEPVHSKKVDRLEAVRVAMGLNQEQFAKILHIKPGSYSDIKRGRCGISSNMIWKLENELNININWLLDGTGEMYANGQATLQATLQAFLKDSEEVTRQAEPMSFNDRLLSLLEKREAEHVANEKQHYELIQKISAYLESSQAEKKELILANRELMEANREMMEVYRELINTNKEMLSVIVDKFKLAIVNRETV